MKSDPQQIPAAKSCRCGARPVYFSFDDRSGVVFHRMMCPQCGKKVTRLSKFWAVNRWNEYIAEITPRI